MKIKKKSILIRSQPSELFAYMDNIANTGMHMTKSSMPMMGGKLVLEQLSPTRTGTGSRYRWYGKVVGFTMDFIVVVTTWIEGKEKIWETVGEAKMIILSWYRMHLTLTPQGEMTKAELSIEYEIPKKLFYRVLGFLLAPWYASWCLKQMLQDSKTALESRITHRGT